MSYSQPKITRVISAIAAAKAQGASKAHIVPDSISPAFPYATSVAYEADE